MVGLEANSSSDNVSRQVVLKFVRSSTFQHMNIALPILLEMRNKCFTFFCRRKAAYRRLLLSKFGYRFKKKQRIVFIVTDYRKEICCFTR